MPPITTKAHPQLQTRFCCYRGLVMKLAMCCTHTQNLLVQDNAPLAILAFSDRHLVGLG